MNSKYENSSVMKKNVLLTGGTGFIGKKLTELLIENGFSVSILSRTAKQNYADISYFQWDVESGTIDEEAILKADYVIHLAGENIGAKRWGCCCGRTNWTRREYWSIFWPSFTF